MAYIGSICSKLFNDLSVKMSPLHPAACPSYMSIPYSKNNSGNKETKHKLLLLMCFELGWGRLDGFDDLGQAHSNVWGPWGFDSYCLA